MPLQRGGECTGCVGKEEGHYSGNLENFMHLDGFNTIFELFLQSHTKKIRILVYLNYPEH